MPDSRLRKICLLAQEPDFWQTVSTMSEDSSLPASSSVASPWKPDKVFAMLAEPPRRRVLQALAGGTAVPAVNLAGTAGVSPDATLKHLSAMHKAGLLAATPDRVDKRRMLYSLSPSVTVVKTATGTAIDFGCCVLVCQGTIQLAGIPKMAEAAGKD